MNKKSFLILISLIFVILFQISAYASQDINIFIDGNRIVFNPSPVIQNGTTLVPMRDCFETLGCKIYWNQSTKTATAIRDDLKIKVTIGNIEAFINDDKRYLSVAPQILGESTYVPLRFVSESLGAVVNWDGNSRTITIDTNIESDFQKYTLLDSQEYELRTTYTFFNNGDEVDANFDILIGTLSDSPYQIDSSFDIEPSPKELYDDNYGNIYAKINLEKIKSKDTINITVTKKLTNSGIKYNIDEENVDIGYSNLDNSEVYVNPQSGIESDDPLIIAKAKELSENESNPYLIAKNVFEFVNKHLAYDTSENYARKGALNALKTGRGLCEDYAKLFVALMRANNIPARAAFGYWINSDIANDIEYDSWYNLEKIPHEWAEFYLDGYGWIIVEPTYFYSINGEHAVPWKQFANQDAHGHIIFGYEQNAKSNIEWIMEGYGKLSLKYVSIKTEIKKIR